MPPKNKEKKTVSFSIPNVGSLEEIKEWLQKKIPEREINDETISEIFIELMAGFNRAIIGKIEFLLSDERDQKKSKDIEIEEEISAGINFLTFIKKNQLFSYIRGKNLTESQFEKYYNILANDHDEIVFFEKIFDLALEDPNRNYSLDIDEISRVELNKKAKKYAEKKLKEKLELLAQDPTSLEKFNNYCLAVNKLLIMGCLELAAAFVLFGLAVILFTCVPITTPVPLVTYALSLLVVGGISFCGASVVNMGEVLLLSGFFSPQSDRKKDVIMLDQPALVSCSSQ